MFEEDPIDLFIDESVAEESEGIFGSKLPSNPDAIPIDMSSVAILFKLSGGASPTNNFGVTPYADQQQNIGELNEQIIESLESGGIVGYTGDYWKIPDIPISEGAILSEEGISGFYKPTSIPDTPDTLGLGTLEGMDKIKDKYGYYARDVTEDKFIAQTPYHELLHFGGILGHFKGRESGSMNISEISGISSDAFNKQAFAMAKTAEFALEGTGYNLNDLWQTVRRGGKITDLFSEDFFDDQIIDGETYTFSQRISKKAQDRIKEIEAFYSLPTLFNWPKVYGEKVSGETLFLPPELGGGYLDEDLPEGVTREGLQKQITEIHAYEEQQRADEKQYKDLQIIIDAQTAREGEHLQEKVQTHNVLPEQLLDRFSVPPDWLKRWEKGAAERKRKDQEWRASMRKQSNE